MRYEIDFTDGITGATTPIDVIEAADSYTSADYIKDCEKNADSEWVEMLHSGKVNLVVVEN